MSRTFLKNKFTFLLFQRAFLCTHNWAAKLEVTLSSISEKQTASNHTSNQQQLNTRQEGWLEDGPWTWLKPGSQKLQISRLQILRYCTNCCFWLKTPPLKFTRSFLVKQPENLQKTSQSIPLFGPTLDSKMSQEGLHQPSCHQLTL